eukprot:1156142-Pelagomonas_calceolata.AAC.10
MGVPGPKFVIAKKALLLVNKYGNTLMFLRCGQTKIRKLPEVPLEREQSNLKCKLGASFG